MSGIFSSLSLILIFNNLLQLTWREWDRAQQNGKWIMKCLLTELLDMPLSEMLVKNAGLIICADWLSNDLDKLS